MWVCFVTRFESALLANRPTNFKISIVYSMWSMHKSSPFGSLWYSPVNLFPVLFAIVRKIFLRKTLHCIKWLVIYDVNVLRNVNDVIVNMSFYWRWGSVIQINFRLLTTNRSFFPSTIRSWDTLEQDLRHCPSFTYFKSTLKSRRDVHITPLYLPRWRQKMEYFTNQTPVPC